MLPALRRGLTSLNTWIHQSFNQSIGQYSQPNSQSSNQSSKSICQSVSQSINQAITHSINQSVVSQSITHSLTHPLTHSPTHSPTDHEPHAPPVFQTWPALQTLMGQCRSEGLLHRVQLFQPASATLSAAEDVDRLLKTVTYDQVLLASNSTARFHVWVSTGDLCCLCCVCAGDLCCACTDDLCCACTGDLCCLVICAVPASVLICAVWVSTGDLCCLCWCVLGLCW